MGIDTVYWRLPAADLEPLRSSGSVLRCEAYVSRLAGDFPLSLRRFDTARGRKLTLLLDAIGDPADPFWPLFNLRRPISGGDPADFGPPFCFWTVADVRSLAGAMAELFQSPALMRARIDSRIRPLFADADAAPPERIRLAVWEAQQGFESLFCFFRLAEDAGDAILWAEW